MRRAGNVRVIPIILPLASILHWPPQRLQNLTHMDILWKREKRYVLLFSD